MCELRSSEDSHYAPPVIYAGCLTGIRTTNDRFVCPFGLKLLTRLRCSIFRDREGATSHAIQETNRLFRLMALLPSEILPNEGNCKMPTSSTDCRGVEKAKPAVSCSDPLTITESQTWMSRNSHELATRAAVARSVSGRRRLVDPTTCDVDYNVAEVEFMQAMQNYKQRSGRMFPTWSEVLEVLKNLGYEKVEVPS